MQKQEYYVEKILDYDYNRKEKRIYYLVKWKDFDISQSTWEPIAHLDGSAEILKEFHQQYDQSMKGKYPHKIIPFWINTEQEPSPSQVKARQECRKIENRTKIQSHSILRQMKGKNKKYQQPQQSQLIQKVLEAQTTKKQVSKSYINMLPIENKVQETSKCFSDLSKQKINSNEKCTKTQNPRLILQAEILGLRYHNNDKNSNFQSSIKNPFHNQFEFSVKRAGNNKQEWMPRMRVIKQFPFELCLFYQDKIKFTSN